MYVDIQITFLSCAPGSSDLHLIVKRSFGGQETSVPSNKHHYVILKTKQQNNYILELYQPCCFLSYYLFIFPAC